MNERGGPREEAAHPQPDDILAAYKPLPVGTTRRRWARQLINQGSSDRPEYGSTAWIMLPDDHPDKVAACVVAAECWATAGDHLEEELRREIELARAAFKRAEDEEYQTRAAAHRAKYADPPERPGFIERRAEQLEAAKPRHGDRLGSLDWNGSDSA